MTQLFKEIKIEDLQINPFTALNSDWMLITIGDRQQFNPMTASWGFFGVMWNKFIIQTAIRPSRHTYGFAEKSTHFTVSFFDETSRKALKICGSKSGRNTDKVKESGLTPYYVDNEMVAFEQAKLIFACKKIYFQDINPENFLDAEIGKHYENDFHRMYSGEITKILQREA